MHRAIMAGQVKHKQIFHDPARLAAGQTVLALTTRNTDSLLGAVAKVLADEGICWIIPPHPGAAAGATGHFNEAQALRSGEKDIAYGRKVARHLAQFDIGQTVVIAACARVAVEAMEGTDVTIERAGQILKSLAYDLDPERGLTVVKVAKPNQDMRFDVPVIGLKTIRGWIIRQVPPVWPLGANDACCWSATRVAPQIDLNLDLSQ